MKRFAIATLFNVLLFSTCMLGQNDMTKSEITTSLPDDSTLSAALPRLLPVNNVSCQSYPNSVTFRLYSNESDVSAVWQETQLVTSHPGSYSHIALIGSTTNGVPAEIFSNGTAHWLGIQCTGEVEMPRTMLTGVSYSMRSADSESLAGKPASAYALADAVNTTAITANLNNEISRAQTMEGNLALDLGAEVAARKDAIASIQTSTQTTMLRTDQSNAYTVNTTVNGTPAVVHANVMTFGGQGWDGLRAETDHPMGNALEGVASSTSGNAWGVYGQSSAANGSGVAGESNDTTGAQTTYGVQGFAHSSKGIGVLGQSDWQSGNGSMIGIMGLVNHSSAIAGVFDNTAAGTIISGRSNGTEKFSVDSTGKVSASAFQGDGSALTGVASQASIDNEVSRAQAAETTLTSSINGEISNRQAAITSLTTTVNAEITNRQAAVTSLTTTVTAETTNRQAAVASLTATVNAEITNRQAAVATVTANLDAEVTNRAASEVALQASINAVAASVPKQVFGHLTVSGTSQTASFPAGSFSSAPICVVAPTTIPPTGTPYAVTATNTAVTVTISGNQDISFNYFCSGN